MNMHIFLLALLFCGADHRSLFVFEQPIHKIPLDHPEPRIDYYRSIGDYFARV
nr:hypothetical protein [Planococcus glaciei]